MSLTGNQNHRTHGAYCRDVSVKQKRILASWKSMCTRCFNVNEKGFKNYGGRGIYMCAQWSLDFSFFWSDMEGTRFFGASIDRIDNNGHYNKLNCKWSTPTEQADNRRNRPRGVEKRPPRSEDYKAKLRAARLGKKLSAETRAKMSACNIIRWRKAKLRLEEKDL